MSTRKGDTKEKSTRTTAVKKPAAAKPARAAAAKPPAAKAVTAKPAAKAAPVKTAAKSAAPKPAASKAPIAKAAPVAKAAPPARSSASAKPAVKSPAPARPALAAVPPPGRDGTAHGHTPRLAALTQKDLKRFEELLLGERQRLLRELGHLEKNVLKRSLRETSGELSGYSFHMADVGTDAMEREKAFHFASAGGRALLDVDDALRRLYGGEYGHCESCGNPVSPERLEVVPHARLCLDCKQKEERAQIGRSR